MIRSMQWFEIGLWSRRFCFDSHAGGAVFCCFLQQELYPHCSSRPSSTIGECEATLAVVFPWARNFPHIAPAYPSCNGYLAVLALAGGGKMLDLHENILHVDVAIQGKINITFTYLCELQEPLRCARVFNFFAVVERVNKTVSLG